MNVKHILLLMLVAFAIATTGVSATTLDLYAKYEVQPADYPWPINGHTGAAHGVLTYDIKNTNFVGSFTATKLVATTAYTLIYYKDPYPGTDLKVLGTGTTDGTGTLTISSISASPGDIPALEHGGKIWLVKSSDFSGGQMTAWNPKSYLFEQEGGLNYVSGIFPVAKVVAGYQMLTPPGGTAIIPINVEVVSGDVGSLQLVIDYGHNVGAGSISDVGLINTIGGLEYSVDTVAKKITIAFASDPGLPVGTTEIADITATVSNSDPSAYFGLTLTGTATTLADPNTEINTAVDNGGILILAAGSNANIPGDADDDGYIESDDAQLYLKKAAGLPADGIFANMALGPEITAADALAVLKLSVA
jgi:hypothetical protein